MATKEQPKESRDAAPDNPPSTNVEDVLRPFQQASSKLYQAHLVAQEAALKEGAQAWLDYQEEVRKLEQETHRALIDATRKHVGQLGEQASGNVEQMYAARTRSQSEYENEVRRIYADTQAKLTSVNQRRTEGAGGGEQTVHRAVDQRQSAYQTYFSELQQAWANTKSTDPQILNAIASHILMTINSVGHSA